MDTAIHAERGLSYVLSILRAENEQDALKVKEFSGLRLWPEKRAFLEESLTEIVQSKRGHRWVGEAAALYRSRNPNDFYLGVEVLKILLEKGMAEKVAADRSIVKQAIRLWLDDATVDEGAAVLVPLARDGESQTLVKTPRMFARCADMLTSANPEIAVPAAHLVTNMAEDTQASAIAKHPELMPAIVENYADDDVSRMLRGERILEPLLKHKKTGPEIIHNYPVVDRMRELILSEEKSPCVCGVGLAVTALNHAGDREEVEQYLGAKAVNKVNVLSRNWTYFLPSADRPAVSTTRSYEDAGLHA